MSTLSNENLAANVRASLDILFEDIRELNERGFSVTPYIKGINDSKRGNLSATGNLFHMTDLWKYEYMNAYIQKSIVEKL